MRNALLAAALTSACPAAGYAEAPEVKLTLPQSGVVKVAFVISDQATLIDIVGPMTALGQAQAPGTSGFETSRYRKRGRRFNREDYRSRRDIRSRTCPTRTSS